ncbi:hypothetical protein CVT24_004219 [Panaeolus cyanescens]|uniref:Uncharacterized protein n=1 Tax=Panaeolus cyanescens TaxID=181874 RepID=A0A409YSX0_9AGAR|nr:hypothetical protein CVT24_004219 [Panaeolus cyanescens]
MSITSITYLDDDGSSSIASHDSTNESDQVLPSDSESPPQPLARLARRCTPEESSNLPLIAIPPASVYNQMNHAGLLPSAEDAASWHQFTRERVDKIRLELHAAGTSAPTANAHRTKKTVKLPRPANRFIIFQSIFGDLLDEIVLWDEEGGREGRYVERHKDRTKVASYAWKKTKQKGDAFLRPWVDAQVRVDEEHKQLFPEFYAARERARIKEKERKKMEKANWRLKRKRDSRANVGLKKSVSPRAQEFTPPRKKRTKHDRHASTAGGSRAGDDNERTVSVRSWRKSVEPGPPEELETIEREEREMDGLVQGDWDSDDDRDSIGFPGVLEGFGVPRETAMASSSSVNDSELDFVGGGLSSRRHSLDSTNTYATHWSLAYSDIVAEILSRRGSSTAIDVGEGGPDQASYRRDWAAITQASMNGQSVGLASWRQGSWGRRNEVEEVNREGKGLQSRGIGGQLGGRGLGNADVSNGVGAGPETERVETAMHRTDHDVQNTSTRVHDGDLVEQPPQNQRMRLDYLCHDEDEEVYVERFQCA